MASLTISSQQIDRLSADVVANAEASRNEFVHAKPFRHICIENFFEPEFAERLLAEFPTFDRRLSINEMGGEGGNAVNTKIREISPAYRELYDFIASAPFLDFMSHISGIPGLLLDPKMFGGGTHENRHGQELDPHVDFNYTGEHGLHRRLNLIVYLNKDWKTEWGGAIEIHSNPRTPDGNQIRAFDPSFNRAIMFETNEVSWHGFPRIDLPGSERNRSRKSISIYLYTKDRPASEIAPPHGTFYVQRPLPKRFAAGYALTDDDVIEMKSLLVRRDGWIERYQKMELDKNRQIDELRRYVAQLQGHVRLPVTGYVLQEGVTSGAYGDGWIASTLKARIKAIEPVSGLTLIVYRPEEAGGGRVRILIDGAEAANSEISAGRSEVTASVKKGREESFDIEIRSEAAQKWSPAGDDRDLALMLIEIRMKHPEPLPPIYVARHLSDAQRLEEVFKAAGIDYEVVPETFPGGIIFRSTRVGAFFYVDQEQREKALQAMKENGFRVPR